MRVSVPLLVKILLFAVVFITPTIFRTRDYGSDSIDFQVLIKLALWAGAFGFSAIFIQKWGRQLFQYDNLPLTCIFALMAISCVYAPSFVYSAGAVLSVISVVTLFYFAQRVLDDETILWTVFGAFTTVSALSIIVYFVNPSFGRMEVWVNGSLVPGNRLSGITATANAIGYLSALALMLSFILGYFYKTAKTKPLYVFAFINFIALMMSNSRTSMGALVVALAVVFFARFTSLRLSILFTAIALLAFGTLAIDIEWLLSQISRSGNADEILTGTGRAYIWPVVMDLISQRPFTGWGYGSSSFILPNFSAEIGHVPPHAHNALLQLWLTVGFFAVLAYIVLFLAKVFYSFKVQDHAKLMMLAFLFATSFTESSVWLGVAQNPAILLALIVCLPYRNSMELRTKNP
ncbi:MAG: O-antigen ligase family protein [Pseudomonadota bacterium]